MADSLTNMLPFRVNGSLQLTRYNPPGQTALAYRPGAYQLIVSRMLDELRKQKVTAQNEASAQPLIHFNTLARDDWTVAFLRAWATVSDVLSFYQERIINEGYLRTAVERRSILELTRAVGYELSPPVSATTYLVFAVHEALPGKSIPVPRGTAVQSIPSAFSSSNAIQDIVQGQASPPANLPVIFETSEDLIADAALNALTPARIQGSPWPSKYKIRRMDQLAGQKLSHARQRKDVHPTPRLTDRTFYRSLRPAWLRRQKVERTLRLAGATLGLKPGDLLLIAGQLESMPGLPAWELLLLSEVDSQAKEGYTAVNWKQQFGRVPEAGIANPTVYVFRRKTALFPYAAGAVFRDTDRGWAPTNIGLPPKTVQAAAADREDRLYVGIEQAIFSSGDRGDSWQPISSSLPPKNVHAVATSSSGEVAVGTDDSGVHLSNDGGESWSSLSGPGEVEIPTGWRRFVESVRYKLPKTNIRSLLFTEGGEIGLLAGSDDGVFGYDTRQDSWVSMNQRFPDLDRKKGTAPLAVRALAATHGGKRVWAGTDNGVFPVEKLFNGPSSALLTALLVLLLPGALDTILPGFLKEYYFLIDILIPLGVLWVLLVWQQPFRHKWVGLVMTIALIFGYPGLWSGTGNDFNILAQDLILIFLAWNALRASMEKLPGLVRKAPAWVKELLPGFFAKTKQPRVLSLLAVGAVVYAGTDHGIYRLAKQTWMVRFLRWLRRLILGPEPEPWKEIPGWYDESREIDPADLVVNALGLDDEKRLVAGTLAGNVYVCEPGPTQIWTTRLHTPLTSVRTIVTTKKDTFAMGEPLDARQEVLWAPAQSDAGAVDVDGLSLNVPVDSFAATIDEDRGSLYLVSGAGEQPSLDAKQPGRLTRLTIREKEALPGFDRASTQFFCQSEPLALFDDQFQPHPVQGDQIVLAGRVNGLEPGKILLISGMTPEGQQCIEPIKVKAALPAEPNTILDLEKSLENVYDRDSVTIYGNIVPAIQGQTIRNEYLGESDGAIPNQRFKLSSPLAYVPAEANDYESSLSVLVNKIQWTRVSTLLDQPAGGRVYMVRRNGQGQTMIIFGDGEQGARLPTSREILTATYRSGGGESGNVPPHSLTMLQSHLPHVKGVTNAAPAQGGLSAESGGHGREQAPRRVRALGRIVTLKDYGDFAATFPGVSKAVARALPERAPSWIDIAIVPKFDLPPDSPQTAFLLKVLSEAIEGSRSSAILPFKLRSFRPVPFTLGIRLYVSAAMREDEDGMNELKQRVRKKILETYGREMQILGRDVTEAEIFKLVQSLHGVTAVILTGFQRLSSTGDKNQQPTSAIALTAEWDELLWIEDNDLKLEVAS